MRMHLRTRMHMHIRMHMRGLVSRMKLGSNVQEGKHWILNGARRKRAKVVSYQAMQMTEEQLSSRHVAMQALEIELKQ